MLARSFFFDRLSGGRKLCDLSKLRSLGGLAACVGIDLSVEYHDVHILAGGDDMVKSAEADIICPAVAAEDPDGLLREVILFRKDFRSERAGLAVAVLAGRLQLLHVRKDLGAFVAEFCLCFVGGEERNAFLGCEDTVLQRRDQLLCRVRVGFAVVIGVEPFLTRRFDLGGGMTR